MQKDLFGGVAAVNPISSTFEPHRTDFLQKSVTIRFDQAIIGVLLLIVAYVFVFSFGVESGKRYAMAEIKAERAMRERMARELGEKIFANSQIQAEARPDSNPDFIDPTGTMINLTALKQKGIPSAVTKATKIPASVQAPKVDAKGKMKGKYAVQTVTFTSKAMAQKQLEKLAQKGYQGVIVARGKFLQICVTGFESKDQATQAMGQLKAEGLAPKDAYIRTLA